MKNSVTHENLSWLYLASILLLITYTYLGFFIQPINDDFCFAYKVNEVNSLSENIHKDWSNLNGRWGTSGLRYIFMTLVGIETWYWLTIPLSIIAIFTASLFLANVIASECSRKEKRNLACVNSFIFLSICSSLSDVIFWGTGLTDYTLGYLFVALSIYCTFKISSSTEKPVIFQFFLLLVSTVMACSVAELFSVPVWAFLFFAILFGKNKPYLILPIILMIIATGFNILAPGNEVRSSNITESLSSIDFIKEGVIYGLRGLLLPCLGMYLISFLPGIKPLMITLSEKISTHFSKKFLLLTCLFIIGFPALIIVILLISLGAPGPGRAHNVSLFAIISAWPILIRVIPFLKPSKVKSNKITVFIACLGSLVLITQNNKEIAEDIFTNNAKNFHTELSEIRHNLKQNQKGYISLIGENRSPNFSSGINYFVTEDKNYWINQCVSLYYKLNSIEAKQP